MTNQNLDQNPSTPLLLLLFPYPPLTMIYLYFRPGHA